MARAATTKRRVTPSTATREVRRTGPSRRGSSRGGSAPRATRGAGPAKRGGAPGRATRGVRRTGPSRRVSSRGGSAPRATRGSVLASGGTRRRRRWLVRRFVRGLFLLRLRLGVAVGGCCGLLGALLGAVVRGVEARAFKGDADRLEDLADWGAALDARGQGVGRRCPPL